MPKSSVVVIGFLHIRMQIYYTYQWWQTTDLHHLQSNSSSRVLTMC